MLMQLKKLLKNYRKLIVGIGIILVSLAGFFFGIVPLGLQSVDLQNSIVQLSSDIAVLQQKRAILQSLDEETLRGQLLTLTSVVPPDKSLFSLFQTVDGVTSEVGVSVVDFSLVKPGSLATESAARMTAEESSVGVNLLPLSLTINGSYEQMATFLTTAVNVRRLLRIRSFDLSFENPDVISGQLNMDAAYTPLPARVGAVTDAISLLGEKEEQTISKAAAMPLMVRQSLTTVPSSDQGETAGKDDPFSL